MTTTIEWNYEANAGVYGGEVAELNGARALVELDPDDTISMYWREDPLGGLIFWRGHQWLSDKLDLHHEMVGPWSTAEVEENGAIEYADTVTMIKQLRDDLNCVVLPVYVAEYGSNPSRLRTSWWDVELADGVLWLTSNDICELYGEDTEETRKQAEQALEAEAKWLDYLMAGEVYRIYVENRRGDRFEAIGGYVGDEEAARADAESYLRDFADECTVCDGDQVIFGMPCQECVATGSVSSDLVTAALIAP